MNTYLLIIVAVLLLANLVLTWRLLRQHANNPARRWTRCARRSTLNRVMTGRGMTFPTLPRTITGHVVFTGARP